MPIFSSSTLLQMSATAVVPVSATMSAAATSASASHILNLNHNHQLTVSLNGRRKSISASSSSFISAYRFNCSISRSFRRISYPSPIRIRPLPPVMEWQDCTIKMEVDVPIQLLISVFLIILEDKPNLSRWSLKYKAFGQNTEYSGLARNMQPTPNQKIHWRSQEGLPHRGAVRFFPKGPSSCIIELTFSYEVPQLLVPVASALKPFLENLLAEGLERSATLAKSYSADTPK